MLPRGLVLKNPLLRRERVLTLFRYLLKEAGRNQDEVVRKNVGMEVRKAFREGKELTQYRKYNRAISAGEALAGYFSSLHPCIAFPQRLKANKEIISLAYGKKGPIRDQLAVIPLSTLSPDELFESRIRGKKLRVKKFEVPEELLEYARNRVKGLDSGSVEVLAYRKALSVPSRYTKEEAALEQVSTQRIID